MERKLFSKSDRGRETEYEKDRRHIVVLTLRMDEEKEGKEEERNHLIIVSARDNPIDKNIGKVSGMVG